MQSTAQSKVRALVRVAKPECEGELVELARAMTTEALERELRMWGAGGSEADERKRTERNHRLRRLTVYPNDGADGCSGPGGKVGGRGAAGNQRGTAESGGVSHPHGASRPAATAHLEDGTRLGRRTARRLCCDVATVEVRRDPDGSVLDVSRPTRTIPPALRRALELRDGGCRFPGCGLRFTDGHHLVHWADGGETTIDNLILLCRHHHRLLHEGGWAVHWAGRRPERIPLFVDPRGGFHAEPGRRGLVAERRCGLAPRGHSLERGRTPGAAATRVNGSSDERTLHLVPRPPVNPRPRSFEVLVEGSESAAHSDGAAHGGAPDAWSLHAHYERGSDVPWEIRARAREALDRAHFGG